MDYTTVPRSLIYRERRSLEEFGAYDEDNIMFPLANAMLQMDIIRQADSENRALWCLNTAFYICTMILLEKDPRWRISKYESIATPRWNYSQIQFMHLTLSLVVLLLARLEKPLKGIHPYGEKARMDIYRWLKRGFMYDDLKYKIFASESLISYVIPNSTFAPRIIDKETVNDALMDHDFNWVPFVNFFEERSVRDLINAFGSAESEKHNMVEILRQASHSFYTAGYNDYPEKVEKMLHKIDKEIFLEFNPNEEREITEEDKAELIIPIDPEPYEARIKELEEENKRLSKEIEELKGIKEITEIPLDGIEADSKVGLTEILKLMKNDGANFDKANSKTIAAKALKMMTGRSESACKQIFSVPLSPKYPRHKEKILELNGYLQALGMKTLL